VLITARSSIYPFIGLGGTYDFYKENLSYSAMAGINIKIDTKEKEIPKISK